MVTKLLEEADDTWKKPWRKYSQHVPRQIREVDKQRLYNIDIHICSIRSDSRPYLFRYSQEQTVNMTAESI